MIGGSAARRSPGRVSRTPGRHRRLALAAPAGHCRVGDLPGPVIPAGAFDVVLSAEGGQAVERRRAALRRLVFEAMPADHRVEGVPLGPEEPAGVLAIPVGELGVGDGDLGRVEERDAPAVLGPVEQVVGLQFQALGERAVRDLVAAIAAAVGDHLDPVERMDQREGTGPAGGRDHVGRHRVARREMQAGEDAVGGVALGLPGQLEAALALVIPRLATTFADRPGQFADAEPEAGVVGVEPLDRRPPQSFEVQLGLPGQALAAELGDEAVVCRPVVGDEPARVEDDRLGGEPLVVGLRRRRQGPDHPPSRMGDHPGFDPAGEQPGAAGFECTRLLLAVIPRRDRPDRRRDQGVGPRRDVARDADVPGVRVAAALEHPDRLEQGHRPVAGLEDDRPQ